MKRYSIDPSLISLPEFREMTAERRMLPARVMLHEQMDSRFAVLEQSGMESMGDLLSLLSSKSKIATFAIRTGLPVNYLVLLRREAGSYVARPFLLDDFPGIPFEYLEILKSRRIVNTKQFFEQVQTEQQQKECSSLNGVPVYRLKELFSLCDLSRITGIGGLFARMVYETGIRSTEEFASADPLSLLGACQRLIDKHGYDAGKLGEEDIIYSIRYAKVIVACDRN